MTTTSDPAPRPAATTTTPIDAGMRRLGTVPALDGVRGLAVLLVMMVHLQLLMPYRQTGVRGIDGFIRGGYLGVDLFFVLSGFLITALLLDESNRRGSVRFGAFYIRRALRLLPALYVLLIAHYVYFRVEELSPTAEWETLRSAVLYVSNWQVVRDPSTVAHELTQLWSLSIEEQFYLWWPALVLTFFGPRRSARTVGWALGGMILAVALWRAHLLASGTYWTELTVRTDVRVDGLLIGALLASLWVRRATPAGKAVDRAAWAGLAAIFVCVALFRGPDDIGYQGGLTVYGLAAALVLLGLVNGTWGGRWLFEIRPLRALGRVSYGVYLWHYPIFYVVAIHGQDLPDVTRVALALALTTVAVLASWYLVEKPALALKARFGAHRAVEGERIRDAAPTMALAPVPLPGWGTERGRMWWGVLGIVALVGAVAFVRVAAEQPDPDGPGGLDFPAGDADRTPYWNLVDLEPRIIDSFEREDNPTSLAAADTRQVWAPVSGTWGTEDRQAIVAPADDDTPRLAVLAQPDRDGLVELTLTTMAEGAGILVRYEDPENWWSVIARPSTGQWVVTQMQDGEPIPVAEFEAPTEDGTTVSVTQNDVLLRVLIDGVEHLTTGIDPLEPPFQSGLVAVGPEAHGARWDRYLVLRFEEDPTAGG